MGQGGENAWICLGNERCEDITKEATSKLGDGEDFAGGKKKELWNKRRSFGRSTGVFMALLLVSHPLLSCGFGTDACRIVLEAADQRLTLVLTPHYFWQPILQLGTLGLEKGKYAVGTELAANCRFYAPALKRSCLLLLSSLARCSLGVSCRWEEDFLLDDVQIGQTCCFLIYCCCWEGASWALEFPRYIWTAREDLVSSNNKDLSLSFSFFSPLSLLSQAYIKIRQFCPEQDQGLSIWSKRLEMRRFGMAVTAGMVFLAGCLSDSQLPSP